jgi:DNA invertase Pin-like site-specific DNA recombinase
MTEKRELAVIYARLSPQRTDTRGRTHGGSVAENIERQIERCAEYCDWHRPQLQVVHLIKDPDTSGRLDYIEKRNKGKRLIQLLNSGIKHLVTLRVDRLSRNSDNGMFWLRKWAQKGVNVHFCDQGGNSINAGTATGRMMLRTLLNHSEFQAELTAETTSTALKHNQTNGKRAGGNPPFGKMADPADKTRWIDHPEEMLNIKQMRLYFEQENQRRRRNGDKPMTIMQLHAWALSHDMGRLDKNGVKRLSRQLVSRIINRMGPYA